MKQVLFRIRNQCNPGLGCRFSGNGRIECCLGQLLWSGVFSNPLSITRYLPEVSLVIPAFVALSTPPFEFTGGSPAGGTYSGPGVTNNVFDPNAAGLGTHIITYTYTDNNFCSNSAIDSITVTQFTGVDDRFGNRQIAVYPNPNNGNFNVEFNAIAENTVDLRIFNSLNAMVYEEKGVRTTSHLVKRLTWLRAKGGLLSQDFRIRFG
ncbi:MAG: hypothetical protein R2764_07835 [Bacteroidales bacterium]